MTRSIKILRGWDLDGEQLGGYGDKQEAVDAGLVVELDVEVADSTTDGLHALTLDVSQLLAIYMESDQDVTLETNNGATPDDTIALTANTPYEWTLEDTLALCKLTTDVTALYITNASGSTANIKLRFGVDPTV